jgi:hypothetical protein
MAAEHARRIAEAKADKWANRVCGKTGINRNTLRVHVTKLLKVMIEA